MRFISQKDQMDCGPSCLAMISEYYGKKYSVDFLRENSFLTKEGVSLLGISEAAKKIGFETKSVRINIEDLITNKRLLPCILHWNENHFVVLYKISKSLITNEIIFHIVDPAYGKIKLKENNFISLWKKDNIKGIALFLSPTEYFYEKKDIKEDKLSILFLVQYIKPYKGYFFMIFILLFIGSVLNFLLPFFTEKLIDKGIQNRDIEYIYTILFAQILVFIGSISVDVVRNSLMLFIGSNMSIRIISDFLKKVIKLPIKFFDTKTIGDFNQRIQDNDRIEFFLTSQSLLTFFSTITFLVFFGILYYYDITIFVIYSILTTISLCWSLFWLKRKKKLDYYRFQQKTESQESVYELLNGIVELKINSFENYKIKEWEEIQKKLLKQNFRILKINQIQISGFEFFNQIKNIIAIFIASKFVIDNHMTMGNLLSISYIMGMMNSPLNNIISFFSSMQDAKLSLERMNEVHNSKEEEDLYTKNREVRKNNSKNIEFNNVGFQYEGPKSNYVLQNIFMKIPMGKVTAIVGESGSGKTTIMKLLLRFYNPTEGNLLYKGKDSSFISPKEIRKLSGVVMQDGFIFSDTIERNIIMGDENIIDNDRLLKSIKIANLQGFIEDLPLGIKTKIGASGISISGGQKQRILIARAVYKNPEYIFLDEATSALDSENEKVIHNNLQYFFKGKTVVIIAHRLSTVKNADNIVVLKKGRVVEQGIHQTLVNNQGEYYKLVKNQLELGN